jgi:hypothetical protein
MRWFCRKCWRSGELMCGEDEAMSVAQWEHLRDVNAGIAASRIPAGMDPRARDTPMMNKIPGVYCSCDIRIEKIPVKPKRDKVVAPFFDFDAV